MNKLGFLIIALALLSFMNFVVAESNTTNQTSCMEKENTCCNGESCVGGACQTGYTYNFKACDSNCMPIGGCILETNTTPIDMDTCLDNPINYWNQETDRCYPGFSGDIDFLRKTCSDPDGGINYYSQAHTFGFRSYYANERDKRIRTGGKDGCIGNQLIEHYCDENGFIQTTYIDCPNGCNEGACIQGEQIKEQVKCVFKGSNQLEKCYTAEQNSRAYCSGVEICIADISGYKGEKITWKSSCGGYAYTTITGENKYANFDCSTTTTCSSTQCEDGSWTKCYKDNNGYCTCSTCPPIIIKPVCGNGVCESGEGMICELSATSCESGKECKSSTGKCYYGCEQDCKNIPGIYSKLNEKFKLQVSQSVKIIDYKNMKITFRDLLTPKCEAATTTSEEVKTKISGYPVAEPSSSGGGSGVNIIKCPNVGPMAQLEVEMPEENGKKILTLKLNEAKAVYDVSIVFLDYDYASRTGLFVVNNQTSECSVNCKCDNEGNIISCYSPPNCNQNQILCPDGVCREKCEETPTENCSYGCLYNNKCLPVGIRVKGLYCDIEGALSSQLPDDKTCENNFECSSNVCAGGKCISGSLIQKIINWFKKLFGAS